MSGGSNIGSASSCQLPIESVILARRRKQHTQEAEQVFVVVDIDQTGGRALAECLLEAKMMI